MLRLAGSFGSGDGQVIWVTGLPSSIVLPATRAAPRCRARANETVASNCARAPPAGTEARSLAGSSGMRSTRSWSASNHCRSLGVEEYSARLVPPQLVLEVWRQRYVKGSSVDCHD